jgi:Dolichyl-phosphate-mannose-protein mannosyltransferase
MRFSPQPVQLRTILWILVVAAVIRLWVMPLWNSFWLDEALTVWAIRDGFWQIFHAIPSTVGSVAFCAVEWIVGRLGGLHEATLRLPSLAAAIAALYVYYRIGAEFIDRSAGLSLVALYIATYQVAIEVPDARPYSVALLAESASLLWLLRWLRDGRVKDGILWMIWAVIAGHFHQFFYTVLPLEGGFVLWRFYRRSFVRAWQLVVCGLIGVALSAPAIPQLLVISKQATTLSWAPRPTFVDLFMAVTPVEVLGVLALLVLLEWLDGRRPSWSASEPSDAAALGALLLFAPAGIAFVLSRFTEVHVFQARWLLPTVPGAIWMWGWLLHGFRSPFVREMSIAGGLAACIVIAGGLSAVPDYRQEDWRSAVRSLPESGAMLAYCGLVESRRLDWLQQPEHWSYLMAPVLAYRPNVQPGDAFVMPFDFDPAGQEYMERLIEARIRTEDKLTVVTRQSFAGPAWVPWVDDRLEKLGFRHIRNSAYGRVRVEVFQRLSP